MRKSIKKGVESFYSSFWIDQATLDQLEENRVRNVRLESRIRREISAEETKDLGIRRF